MEKIKVRKARIKDIEEIRPLFVDFMNYHGRLDPIYAIVKNNKEHVLKYLRKSIYGRKTIFLVAEIEGKIVGIMGAGFTKMPLVYKNRNFGVIFDAFVVKPARRKGVNTLMLDFVLDWFKEKKIKRVELGFHSSNDLAVKTWKAHGFKTISQRGRMILS